MSTAGNLGVGGSFVGSYLETLGYHYQAMVLDVLGKPFTESIGALVFLVGAIVALVTFVFTGNYKFSRWFVFGPGMFFLMIIPRDDINPAQWRFAGQTRNQELVEKYAKKTLKEKGVCDESNTSGCSPVANVSSVFAQYNRLISTTVEEICKVIVGNRARLDLKFVRQLEMVANLKGYFPANSNFNDLLNRGFVGNCRDVMALADKSTENPMYARYTENEREAYKAEYKQKLATTYSTFQTESPGLDYIAELKAGYPDIWSKWSKQGYEPTISDLKSAVESMKAADSSTTSSSGTGKKIDEAKITKAKTELAKELGGNSYNLTCGQIWNLTLLGIYNEASEAYRKESNQAKVNGLTENDVMKQVFLTIGAQYGDTDPRVKEFQEKTEAGKTDDPSFLYGVISKYVFRNAIADSNNNASFLRDLQGREEGYRNLNIPAEQVSAADIEQARQKNEQWRYKTEMMTTAQQLPYYQGLILYFLAQTFPFFALILLVPGKHAGFIKWFFLWMWAKSWDIGFAIAMLLDNFLVNIMAVQGVRSQDGQVAELQPDLAKALYAIKHLDPSFELTTYYNIMGVTIASIPVIASYFFLNAGRQFLEMIGQGTSEFASGQSTGMSNFGAQPVILAGRDLLGRQSLLAGTSLIKAAYQNKDFRESLKSFQNDNPDPMSPEKYQAGNIIPALQPLYADNAKMGERLNSLYKVREGRQFLNNLVTPILDGTKSSVAKDLATKGVIGGLKTADKFQATDMDLVAKYLSSWVGNTMPLSTMYSKANVAAVLARSLTLPRAPDTTTGGDYFSISMRPGQKLFDFFSLGADTLATIAINKGGGDSSPYKDVTSPLTTAGFGKDGSYVFPSTIIGNILGIEGHKKLHAMQIQNNNFVGAGTYEDWIEENKKRQPEMDKHTNVGGGDIFGQTPLVSQSSSSDSEGGKTTNTRSGGGAKRNSLLRLIGDARDRIGNNLKSKSELDEIEQELLREPDIDDNELTDNENRINKLLAKANRAKEKK